MASTQLFVKASIRLVGPEDVQKALDEIEKINLESANLLRNYIRGLESALDAYNNAFDYEPETKGHWWITVNGELIRTIE